MMDDETAATDAFSEGEDPMLDEEPATFELLETLYLEDLLSRPAYDRARTMIWPAERAWYWLDRGLLYLGALLALAGLVFGFAYNWSALPAFAKFAFLEGAMVACLVGAWAKGWKTTAGRVGVWATCVLVGVFLAVFGQVYQTGADSWELFATWAVLVSGYVGLTCSQPLWLFWFALVHLTVWLFWYQTYTTLFPDPPETFALFWGLGTFDAGGIALRDLVRWQFDPEWLDADWPRLLLATVGLGMFCLPAWWYAGFISDPPILGVLLGGGAWGMAVAVGYGYFRWGDYDRLVLAAVGVAACSLPVLTFSRRVAARFDGVPAIGLLLMAIAVFVATGLLVLWLRWLPAEADEARREGGEQL